MNSHPIHWKRSWPVATVLAIIVTFELVVAVVSIDLLASVRAYVTGESLYSKGQKDAQIYLLDYAQGQREEDYQRFLRALAVPLGDRRAREELEKASPDLAAARAGFLSGGNHPADVDGLIRLFRWFHRVPFMADAISIWREGDVVIGQMQSLVERARASVIARNAGADEFLKLREQAPLLNSRLTELESSFSAQLGEASRQMQRLLIAVNVIIATVLALTGFGFIRRSTRIQVATEGEVRRRQQSLQRLLDSAAEGVFGVDMTGRCTFVNRAALEILGYEREADLLGKEMHALVNHSHADGRVHSASESRMYQAFRERQELHVADEVFWRRDGTSVPVEYWSHPVLQDDEVQGAVATFFDISERLRMQAALRQGEIRMTQLVDAVTDGVLILDADENIVMFNRAAEHLFGVAAAEAIGVPVDRFVPHCLTEGGTGQARPHAIGFTGALHDLIGRRADGSEFPMEASLSKLDTEGGTLMTMVFRDVTQARAAHAERQAREALEASSRAKTEFLSRMSHELRTPLNAVLGFSQLLRLDTAWPPSLQQLERIQHIENAGTHLLALVNDVLELSRVESGQMKLLLGAVSLRLVVEDALAMVTNLASGAGVECAAPRLSGGLPGASRPSNLPLRGGADALDVWVLADSVRLRQVLVNLLTNGIKYNRIGGSVRVSCRRLGSTVQVAITDTGPGIPSDKLSHLFEPFNRLGAESSKIEGTGIGLVLSRRLVELMRGELTIASTVGRGTVANLVLEACGEPFAGPLLQAPPSQHGMLDGSLNVLYAEDNEVNVELVRQVARLRPSIALRIAENGTRAVYMALRDPPDLMLVDMNLGDMTGMELAQELRRHAATRGVRLVALSADAMPEQIDAALAFGFECYLTKPIDFRKLLNVLDGRPDS